MNRTLGWTLAVVGAIAAGVVALREFPRAFPIVALDLEMNRPQALAAAAEFAARERVGPPGDAPVREAARFATDNETQTFVELEAGGRDAYVAMMRDGLHQPYTWQVRRFREGEKREVLVAFTPAGSLWGFREALDEAAPGAALEADSARALAERGAAALGVALEPFRLVESGREVRPGGRVDHSFTYERTDAHLGEDGTYRLALGVSGDRLTRLSRFVQVPEAFTRRYEELRSGNDGIAVAASFVILGLYGLAGLGGGLFWLIRRRALVWRPALAWAVVVAGLNAAAQASAWPLAWFGYDTALPASTFAAQQALVVVAGFVGMGFVLFASFAAAEGLTRAAFPGQVQLWRSWSRDVAPSGAIGAQTALGYLLVPVFFLYVVGFYAFASRVLGWWNPSDALIQPDFLATYAPWLNAIAPSLQAGFWEEALFRAVPLAGAALIGDRFGRRREWVAAAFVLQAVVFAAGHANYPAQPAYARVVELILPSFLFGWVYLRLGLLAGVIMHYVYDVAWFAVPLMVSTARGVWTERALVLGAVLVPVFALLLRRLQVGAWLAVPAEATNAGWVPAVRDADTGEHPVVAAGPQALPPLAVPVTATLAAVGVVLAVWAAGQREPAPALVPARAAAVAAAQAELRALGVAQPAGWRWFARPVGPGGDESDFVWRTAGAEAHRALLGTHLKGPRWQVRSATWRGPVAQRAEEWIFAVGPDGRVERVRHLLPEAAPGDSLDEAAARALAWEGLRANFGVTPDGWEEVSAEPSKRVARLDWTFTVRDTAQRVLPQGELRARAVISGDVVTDLERFVFVPEAWEREERAEAATLGVLSAVPVALLAGVVGAGVVLAIVGWSRKRLAPMALWPVAAVVAAGSVLGAFNGWPLATFGFSTAQPFTLQSAIGLGGSLFLAVMGGAVVLLLLALGATWAAAQPRVVAPWWLGVLAGAAFAGVLAWTAQVGGARSPLVAGLGPWGTVVPWAGPAVGAGVSLPLTVAAMLYVVAAATRAAARRWVMGALLVFAAGFALGAEAGVPALTGWLVTGVVTGGVAVALWALVFRPAPSLVPAAVATLAAMGVLRDGLAGAWPGALVAGAIGLAAVAGLGWWVGRVVGAQSSVGMPSDVR